jgi:ABC-2 type transport system ATP-binding protein
MKNTFDTGCAIEAVGLVKTYPQGRGRTHVRALDGLSLEVADGTVFALLGPNGAGKSTTVKILTTLSRPDGGRATVAGLDVVANPDAVRRVIGVVPQRSSSDPVASARENLLLQGRIHGLGRRHARHRCEELLARFGLVEAADRPVRTYSGGMARRLDVALGLVHRPRVLFLDEPTTGLDPEARARMWAEIGRLAGDERLTVLLTTHYLEEADRLAERVAIVDRGRVVVSGSPDELKSELRGDTVHVELRAPDADGRAARSVGRVAGLHEVEVDGARLRARADSAARAVPAVLAALEEAGVSPVSVTVARPSLDDVYLRHAGRVYEEVGS